MIPPQGSDYQMEQSGCQIHVGLAMRDESYKHAALDLETLIGMKISKSAEQPLMHRVSFTELVVQDTVEELSVDGTPVLREKLPPQTLLRKVRLRIPLSKISAWVL